MAKRKRIALVFVSNNVTNAGIVNYLFSLIKALNTLEDALKPELIIIYSKTAYIDLIKAENYPYISFRLDEDQIYYSNIFPKIINKISRLIFNKNLIYINPSDFKEIDYIFPFSNHFPNVRQVVYWLVDFNPYYFQDHLSEQQRTDYFSSVSRMVYSTNKVVLSSKDVFNDLKKFHPDYTCKVEILHFASALPKFKHVNIQEVKDKFEIKQPYIMTPNQFWVHKNHIIMLKAAKIMKERGIIFQIVFTGSAKVEFGSNYYPSLLEFVNNNGLENEIKFLGIVERDEQLALMKNSEALAQPSLFEGWSTLIEESKALNKHIVVSDIPVHREQIKLNCTFFEPNNETDLANILENIFLNGAEVVVYNYNEDITLYANRILEIFC